ncbi:MAG TPA: hypothetical protein PLB38_03635 [bacterium]|nr:hypothetical protein [bacterium]
MFIVILLIVIAILLASAGLYYFLQDKTPTTNDLPQVNIEQPIMEEPTINEPTDETDEQIDNPPLNEPPVAIPYHHSTYDFSLTFPSTWQGYSAISRNIDWGAPIGSTDSIDFGFPAQDSIFNISIFTPSQWNALQSLGGPMPSYLGENSQYVFAYDMSQFAANDSMADRRNEVSNITRTFRLQ